jgi:hypothetical protein
MEDIKPVKKCGRAKKYEYDDSNVEEFYVDYTKKYYQNNKEKISEINKQPIQCEYGAIICKAYETSHKKSKRHLNNLNFIKKGIDFLFIFK